jgi:tRNA pseudouridine13 synthase
VACTLESAVHDLAFAWGGPPVSGRLRTRPEDFCVRELPLVEPSGEGEHVWLLIRKRQENTDAVARLLAQHAAVPHRNVSYAGLKDRHAVTEQWFSVHLPGKPEPDWGVLESATITLIRHLRHPRKLRRGTLKGNAFRIRLRHERRALRLIIDELVWSWVEPGCLELSFSLPAGTYATSVLRELVQRDAGW